MMETPEFKAHKKRKGNGGPESARFTSTNQPSPEQKKAGWDRWKARKSLKEDLFNALKNRVINITIDGEEQQMPFFEAAVHKMARASLSEDNTRTLLEVIKLLVPEERHTVLSNDEKNPIKIIIKPDFTKG